MGSRMGGGRGGQPNLIFAIFMIAAGILLFLSNLGFLPIRHVWDYWPLVFVAIGLSRMVGCRRPSALIVGALFVVLGVVFTLINTGVFRLHLKDDSWPLSLVFIALGIGGLAKVLDGGKSQRLSGTPSDTFTSFTSSSSGVSSRSDVMSQSVNRDTSPVISNFALMASVNRRVESLNLQGGTLTSLLGSIELDLRRSSLPPGSDSVVMDTSAMLGSIKIRVPESWRVAWNGVQVMGNFEDKTVPMNVGGGPPQLLLTGFIFMGSIEIES